MSQRSDAGFVGSVWNLFGAECDRVELGPALFLTGTRIVDGIPLTLDKLAFCYPESLYVKRTLTVHDETVDEDPIP